MARPLSTDKKTIVAAAMNLLAENGLRGMSIRSVAGALGLAPNTMYSYFVDREQLEAAVAAEVAGRLHAVLLEACAEKTSEESIRSLAKAYLRFAKEQHLIYEALVVTRPASGEDAIVPERLWLFFMEQVRRITGASKSPEAAVALWAFLHGIAALQSAQAFNEEKPVSSFEFGLSAWIEAAKVAWQEDPTSCPAEPARPKAAVRSHKVSSRKALAVF
jgi:AcrR family transcriptional regulator